MSALGGFIKKITDAYIRSIKGAEKKREILIDQRLYPRVTLLKTARPGRNGLSAIMTLPESGGAT